MQRYRIRINCYFSLFNFLQVKFHFILQRLIAVCLRLRKGFHLQNQSKKRPSEPRRNKYNRGIDIFYGTVVGRQTRALISISDVDINDSVLYRSQPHYQTVALRKPTMAAHRCFDCLFAAASITVVRRPINQAVALTHNGNYLYHSGHFLLTAAGAVQLLQRCGRAGEYK